MNRKMVLWLVLVLGAVFMACSHNDFGIKPLGKGKAQIVAYSGTKKTVRIPSKINGMSIIGIEINVFNNRFYEKQLTSVTIPNSVTFIGDSSFYGNQLTSVTIPNSVTFIGEKAFANNQLNSVTIPNSVTFIDRFAFFDNQLTNVIIPNSVTSIGRGAFANNQITKIIIGSNVYLGNKLEILYFYFSEQFEYLDNKEVFENGFDEFYEANGKKAGTYVFDNVYGKWSEVKEKNI